MDGLLGLDHVRDIAVPDALANIGIDSIYAVDDGIYFEYSKSIMDVTPFGILQTKDAKRLDGWYKTKPIEPDWYYYRIVS